jgi:hypothetical protein
LAAGADLSLPEVEGTRPLPVRIANKYVDRVLAAAESDLVVAEQFAKVVGFLDPPTSLFRPGLIARVATASLRRQRSDRATTEKRCDSGTSGVVTTSSASVTTAEGYTARASNSNAPPALW